MEYKTYSSGLRALLSMRDISLVMEKHNAQIKGIENNMEEINKNVLLEFEPHSSPAALVKVENVVMEINDAVLYVTKALSSLREKIAEKNRSDSSELWKRFDLQLDILKAALRHLKDLGPEVLPENMHVHWESKIDKLESTLLSSIVTYARSCRVELQMIERYTTEELNVITQIVLDKIPKDFNVEEAEAYEKDYLSALKDFKKEFSEKKNLWDTFLDILAGGVHQSPSEHVMLERWIEGEKRDL